MAQEHYNHQEVEKKWQNMWYASEAFRAPATPGKSKAYILDMFPYPSGDGLHVGHPEGYTASDIFSRYLRMRGQDVLHPMGWDAFGLPAENYAIKTGTHPAITTKKNIETFKRQIQSLGFSYDWSREVNTTDPEYYKWTQWIFLKLFAHGLAYEAEAPINWCPKDKTGLANEEVVGGKCDRCGTVVEKKNIRQWLVKITDAKYVERLLNDLDALDWPNSIKQSQRNWIGKSEGVQVNFALDTPLPKKVVILHGYKGDPDTGWKAWLIPLLEKADIEVHAPRLPGGENPNLETHLEMLDKIGIDEDTVVIGHSLGCITALEYLQSKNVKIQRLLLVAPPYEKVRPKEAGAHAPGAVAYSSWNFHFSRIKKHVGEIIVLADLHDDRVRLVEARAIAKKLEARLIEEVAPRPHYANRKLGPFAAWTILHAAVPGVEQNIPVFTTRPDTLFGATYMVLSPEHPLVPQITTEKQRKVVEKYQKQASQKSDLDRTDLAKEKTGVFTGAYAVNPVNNEKVPVWIADYVLDSYGTGAIMAVPAHDERDFAFAKRYELPITQVIAPLFVKANGPDGIRADLPFTEREAVVCIIKHWSQEKYLGVKWKANGWQGLVIGGIEQGESAEAAGAREISEETGYQNVQSIGALDGIVHSQFYQSLKNQNRFAHFHPVVMQLTDGKQVDTDEKEKAMHDFVWLSEEEMDAFITHEDMRYIWNKFLGQDAYTGEGVMVTPSAAPPSKGGDGKVGYDGPYEGLTSQEFRKSIVAWLEKTGKGKAATNYKLRDWVFSRQRYWGEPIPIVHCPTDGIVGVPEEQLPVVLPDVQKYEPTGTGESPLAGIKDWVNTTCPKCGGPAKRETNTMPQWAGSNWYFLRYCDPHNSKQLADPAKLKTWLPVDTYIGGAEHAVLHLLYARFIYKFLRDIDAVPKELPDEPFVKLINQGLILGEDGVKMSKSRGNVINPDLVVREYGADSLRMFEMFMGPLEDAKPWSTRGIVGVRRFLDRIWDLCQADPLLSSDVRSRNEAGTWELSSSSKELHSALHRTIKKVTEDIDNFHFNTAVSELMVFSRAAQNNKAFFSTELKKDFIKLLSPFAPHMAEELWQQMHQRSEKDFTVENSIASQRWPSFDASRITAENVEVVVQVNGKVRDKFVLPTGTDDSGMKAKALASEKIQKWLGGKQPKKVIVVQGKLVSIVV